MKRVLQSLAQDDASNRKGRTRERQGCGQSSRTQNGDSGGDDADAKAKKEKDEVDNKATDALSQLKQLRGRMSQELNTVGLIRNETPTAS